ncbi:MAG TPA: chemotaxis protein CheW [Candidatus Binatia bacterium]|nr:chemotaxis protein CheW [Candidatus Binatia bacterium]
MVFLLFQIDRDRYALDIARVAEVVPLVALKRVPGATAGVAGLCDYRGTPVPVLDLASLALGRPARERLGTRIVMVRLEDTRLLGLIAENATDTMVRADSDFTPAGLAGAAWAGPVCRDARGLVQRVEPDRLLDEALRAALYGAEA